MPYPHGFPGTHLERLYLRGVRSTYLENLYRRGFPSIFLCIFDHYEAPRNPLGAAAGAGQLGGNKGLIV